MFRTLKSKSPRLFTFLGFGLVREGKNPLAEICNTVVLSLFVTASLLLLLNWELHLRHNINPLYTYWLDGIVWVILLFNYSLLLRVALNKKQYIKENWLQPCLIIIGAIILFHHSLLVNYIMYTRPLLAFVILLPTLRFLFSLFVDGCLWTTLIAAVVIIVFFGILASVIDPSIGSVGNGLWWALATVSTVGYGDIVPTTLPGRLLGTLLISIGLGLFAIITANVVRIMLSKEAENLNITPESVNPDLQDQLNSLFSNQKQIFKMLENIKQEIDQLNDQ